MFLFLLILSAFQDEFDKSVDTPTIVGEEQTLIGSFRGGVFKGVGWGRNEDRLQFYSFRLTSLPFLNNTSSYTTLDDY